MIPATPLNKAQFTLAMLCGAAVPFFIQWLIIDHVHPAYIAFARAALALVGIAIISALTLQSPFIIKFRDWPALALGGLLLGCSWYCHARAIALAHVPAAEAAFAIYPILSILLTRQSAFHLSYIFVILIALIGVTLALPDFFNITNPGNVGVLYSLGAVLLLVLSHRATLGVSRLYPMDRASNAIMLIQYFFAALLLVPAFFATPQMLTPPIAGKLLTLGLVISALSRLLMSASAMRIEPALSIFIFSLQPLIAVALAAALLPQTEIPTLRAGIGLVIVCFCAFVASNIQRIGPTAIFRPFRWN